MGPKMEPAYEPYKSNLFSSLKDRADTTKAPGSFTIVEIGAGCGANFKYYPAGAKVICVEPNTNCEGYMMKTLGAAGKEAKLEVEFMAGKAEEMDFISDDSVDAVVCTLVLCSVCDVQKSLKEVKRILKQGGKYYFFEHVAEEEGSKARFVQGLLAPLWRSLMDCRMAQDTEAEIKRAGFSSVVTETVRIREIPKLVGGGLTGAFVSLFWRHTFGTATK